MADRLLEEYLPPEALASELGVSLRTIYRWNALGYGPPRVKLGNKVLYHISAVRDWLRANERQPVRGRP
jgi:predicted DNA-binding transcriptional regulator AlpA